MVAEIVDLEPTFRKLVTIRRVKAIDPIPNADAIEVVTVDGWKVVAKKGEFSVGDECVYFEIDSFLPEGNPAWQFLVDKSARVFEGQRGHVLRTVTLRGQISQGLILTLDAALPGTHSFVVGDEVTRQLGVKKWEPEIPAELAGQVKGPFPSWIRKTDQERCQNIGDVIFADPHALYEVSTKLDGTSCTIYYNRGEIGVCSRNLEFKDNDENADNTMIKLMRENRLDVSLPALGRNVAIQGEVMGPGIQKNREQLKKAQLFVFDVYDIDRGQYMAPPERAAFIAQLQAFYADLQHVPVMYTSVSLNQLGITDVDGLLKFAEGPSLNHMIREGLVFKRIDGLFSFKAISQQYLLKVKE